MPPAWEPEMVSARAMAFNARLTTHQIGCRRLRRISPVDGDGCSCAWCDTATRCRVLTACRALGSSTISCWCQRAWVT
jgi:hypothetical protein